MKTKTRAALMSALAAASMAATTLTAAPADASILDPGRCHWKLAWVNANYMPHRLPAKYVIDGRPLPVSAEGGDCFVADSYYLKVNLHDARTGTGLTGSMLTFEGCDSEWTDSYSHECIDPSNATEFQPRDFRNLTITKPGRYVTHYVQGYAFNFPEEFYEDSLTPQTITAKFSTHVTLNATRDGRHVVLTASATRSTVTPGRDVSIGHVAITVQRKVGSKWTTWKTMRAGVRGSVVVQATMPTAQRYRAVLAETSGRWASTSRAVTK